MAGKGNAAAMGDGIAVLIRGTIPGTPACIRSGRQAGRRGWHGSAELRVNPIACSAYVASANGAAVTPPIQASRSMRRRPTTSNAR